MCDTWDQTPSDTQPPAEAHDLYDTYRQATDRFNSAKVVDIDVMRRRRDLARAAEYPSKVKP